MARNHAHRRGRFESLEQKHMLAGDVLVSAVNGSVNIEGDAADNLIMITAGTEAGSFVVTGLDGTTVTMNGETSSEVTINGARKLNIDLGEGDDLAAVVGANVRGDLNVRTGEGDDRVLIGTGGGAVELNGLLPADVAVSVNGRLRVDTGAGEDLVNIDAATVRGEVSVRTGDDIDEVTLGGTVVGRTDVGLHHGRGFAFGRLHARSGLNVDLGAGGDTLNIDDVTVRGAVRVNAGAGADTVNVDALTSAGLVVLGGEGLDTISLNALNTKHVGVHAGEGDDEVEIRDSVFTSLGVALGEGGDTLTVADTSARFAVLLGGDGEDTLELLTGNDLGRELIRGFEVPADVNVNNLVRRGFGRLARTLR